MRKIIMLFSIIKMKKVLSLLWFIALCTVSLRAYPQQQELTDFGTAQWIGLDKTSPGDTVEGNTRLAARYLRKEFRTENKKISLATLYITGLGHYEAYINGTTIGDQVLAPALTDYTKSVKYNTFDITAQIANDAENTLAVALGNGRYLRTTKVMRNFGFPKMLARLEISYADGSKQIVESDNSWKITPKGPIFANNLFDGEEYDARKELTGWKTAGYDDSDWLAVEMVDAPEGKLSLQTNPPIKIMETLHPIGIKETKPSVYILDMGQNMVGWLQIKVRGNRGDTVRMRFAETLRPNGEIYTANLRGAKATDLYICKGGGEEMWEPKFVYHGFRYVEISVSGQHIKCRLDDFEGKVIYDEMKTIGSFETSDSTLNQIYRNAYWGIRGNYHSIPTDCPQRDERQGWLGDRTTNVFGESFIFDNHALYTKWLEDIEEAQRADGSIPDVAPIFWNWSGYTDNMTWPHAYLTIAEMLYQQFGDLQPIEKHYNSMKRWLDYMSGKYLEDGIMARDRYGDWCLPPEDPKLIHSKDSTRITNGALLGTAYYYRSLALMENFAELLNKNEDKEAFSAEKKTVKTAFNNKFWNTENSFYDNNTVTANLIPLCFGMVPNENEAALFQNIVRKIEDDFRSHVPVGVIGIQWLMRGLTENGRGDLALKIATNRDYPSWGYMIDNGATTIWELWNGNTANPSMNSGNHVMLLGDLIIWYYQYLGGIRNAGTATAYRNIELRPYFIDGIDFVNCSYETPYGEIKSSWKRTGKQIVWNFIIPAETTAIVFIPNKKGFSVKQYKAGKYQLKIKTN